MNNIFKVLSCKEREANRPKMPLIAVYVESRDDASHLKTRIYGLYTPPSWVF